MTPLTFAEDRLCLLAGRLLAMAIAIAWCLVVFIGPVFQGRQFALWRYSQVLPVIVLTLSVLLPAAGGAIGLRLRAASLTVLGLSPFLTWFLRSDGQPYFAVCTLLLTAAALWLLLEISLWLRALAVDSGANLLKKLAQNSVVLVQFGAIIPISAIHLAFLVLLGGDENGWSPLDLRVVWSTGIAHLGILLRVLLYWTFFHIGAVCLIAGLLGQRRLHQRLVVGQSHAEKEQSE